MKRTAKGSSYFSVRAVFAVVVAGNKKGLQTCEDRIVVIKAGNKDDAKKRAKKEFVRYSKPYSNAYGRKVRWKLERVVDVYETYIKELRPDGAEVYSRLFKRRISG